MGLTQITTGGLDNNINIGSNVLKIDGTNNRVGIGTSSPASLLNISASSGGATSGLRITRTDSGGGDWRIWSSATVNGEGAGKLIFANSGNRVAIDGSGNFGIDTMSPGYKLDVNAGSTTSGGLRVSGSSSPQIRIEEGSGVTASLQTDGATGYVGTISNNNFVFRTNAIERMRIDTSGNVGIGTTSPDEDLHIFSSTGAIKIDGSGDTALRFATSGTNKFSIFQSSDTLRFFDNSNNAERIRIDNAGNVGIGTSSPTQFGPTLQVAGTDPCLILQDTATAVDYFAANVGNGHVTTWFDDAASLRIGTAAGISGANYTERLRIDSSGRLMLGTSTTRAGGLGIAKGFSSSGVPAAGTSTSSLLVGNDDGGSYGLAMGANGSGNGYIQAQRSDGNTTIYDLYLQPNGGKVTIGTQVATAGLTVYGGSSAALFQNSNTGTGSDQGMFVGNWGGLSGSIWNYENDIINFGTNNTERMRIQSDGVVRITQAGGNTFRVQNSTSSGANMLFQNSTTGTSVGNGLYFGIGDNETSYMWNYQNEPIILGTNNQERFRLDRTGTVLINVTTPSPNIANHYFRVYGQTVLGSIFSVGRSGGDYDGAGYNVGWQSSNGQYKYVASDSAAFIKYGGGNGRIETFTAGAGTAGNSISFTSGPYVASGANSWTNGSDERLKTNLAPIENGLAKVGTLRAVTGRYLTDEESTSRAFLIAQDVQKVLPEAVDDYDPESLGLSYTATIPLLVAALKEAKDKIETLETKVAALEAAE